MVPGFSKKEIRPSKSVGLRLKEARRRLEFSLEDAERLTKVKLKYLKALEDDRPDLLPSEVYALGFLRCYGEALRLNTKKLLAQYQQEQGALTSAKAPASQRLAPAKRLPNPKLLITPKTIVLVGSIVLALSLIIYIVSGVHGFLAPPYLTIEKPPLESRVATSSIEVAGQVDPSASLSINGELVALDSLGRFKREIVLIPGLNALEFVAINRIGKESRQIRKVLSDQPFGPEAASEPEVSPSPSPLSSPTPTAVPS